MKRLRRSHLAWLAALVPLAIVLVAIAFGIAWLTAPSVSGLGASVRMLDRANGSTPVRLAAVAPVMREAVVATEDERFYRHDGIDVIGILRAVPYDVSQFSLAEGASTITEQLAKLVYLGGNDHNPWAKLRDAAIALRIEGAYSKDQILQDYLNTVYFGAGAYGIEAASRRYFGVDASKLDLAQATLLAGSSRTLPPTSRMRTRRTSGSDRLTRSPRWCGMGTPRCTTHGPRQASRCAWRTARHLRPSATST
jgi:membrane peptidoglycan carboxypeptidase